MIRLQKFVRIFPFTSANYVSQRSTNIVRDAIVKRRSEWILFHDITVARWRLKREIIKSYFARLINQRIIDCHYKR